MASCLTTSWHMHEGKLETVADFIFLGSKITMNLDCSHKIKTHLLLEGRKAMKNLNNVLKTRDSLCYRGLQCHSYDFASNHVPMCDLDHKKGRKAKN